MSLNIPKKLVSVVVLRDNTPNEGSFYYMVLHDIVSIRKSGKGIDEVVSVLSDDEYCYLDDVFGKRHKLYFSDLRHINNIQTCDQEELFITLINTWITVRDGKK